MSLIAEGNKGGDRLEMRVVYQDNDTAMIHLRVGSSCVYTINHIVPVELLTSLLSMAFGYGDVKGKASEWLEWSSEVNEAIIERIAHWSEFDDWWFENEEAPVDLHDAFRMWQNNARRESWHR